MTSISYDSLVQQFIQRYGEDQLIEYLQIRLHDNNETLTIIGNAGVHTIPEQFLHGEVYEASSGNLDLSSQSNLEREYKNVLKGLSDKLKEKAWRKVYFVPTGHSTLVMQIKLMVYHILRLNTVDLFYSKGEYFEVEMDYREILPFSD